jgi:hypothetical protein
MNQEIFIQIIIYSSSITALVAFTALAFKIASKRLFGELKQEQTRAQELKKNRSRTLSGAEGSTVEMKAEIDRQTFKHFHSQPKHIQNEIYLALAQAKFIAELENK